MLQTLNELSEFTYLRHADDFIAYIVRTVEGTSIHNFKGWMSHLLSYEWNGTKAGQAFKARRVKKAKLRAALQCPPKVDQLGGLRRLFRGILEWGRMREFSDDEALPAYQDWAMKIATGICELRRTENSPLIPVDLAKIESTRMPAVSKFYAFDGFEYWTIYDSRVSAALGWLLDGHLAGNIPGRPKGLIYFPVSPGRARDWEAPDRLPTLGTAKQSGLAFLYASWLFREIARRLRELPSASLAEEGSIPKDLQEWQVLHVEMVFFMLGRAPFRLTGGIPDGGT